MTDAPAQTWWTAAEIAEARLPDMPTTKRRVNDLARRQSWASQPGKARRRKGKGGGLEYHVSLFPTRAKVALSKMHGMHNAAGEAPKRSRDQAWTEFDKLKAKAKETAESRLAALREVEALERAGLTRTEAVRAVARQSKRSEKTLWNWLSLIEGIAPEDWLPYLAPSSGRGRKTQTPLDEQFLDLVKTYFLTKSQPPLTAAYEWAEEVAQKDGIPVAPLWKVRRVIAETVPEHVQVYLRKGAHALSRYFPHQTRDKTYMHAMEAVQTDYHKFDVFIQFPDREKPGRIQMIAISDIYSGKFLAYRLSETANGHTVQLAFGDLVRRYGIPQHCLMDNGHEFVNKVMTGQTEHRKRFKLVQGEVLGLFPLLGIELHFATPGWGQAKPIERAFKDLCDRVAKNPAFVGAYTGRNTVEKPENYGARAIPLEDFRAVLEREIAAHNARRGRRSEVANQRSFDEVFNESYAASPITKPTEEQQRLWLMRAEGVRADRQNGEVSIYGSRYWAEWMWQIAGKDVTVRFDPDDLQAGLSVYEMDGTFLGDAPVKRSGKFLSVADAKEHARDKKAFKRLVKEKARIEKKMTDAAAAKRLAAAREDAPGDGLPEAGVIKLPKIHPSAPKGGRRRAVVPEEEERLSARVLQMQEHRSAPKLDVCDPEENFARALELEQMQADGQPMTPEQADWLGQYQTTSEYRSRVEMHRALGKNNK
ncbi:Mu transposase C-terminal domain-containing protein [Mameliella alba]|nr:Mu transposase C-terminal domain-containing protein [Antarctobacter heliothermus]MBY6147309.1 Mu transposase C-terminal domain-containing protein [Mameliella alba]MCA0957369.1 Mu transposase C-terminal domain-containing protein [Mameliella alba]